MPKFLSVNRLYVWEVFKLIESVAEVDLVGKYIESFREERFIITEWASLVLIFDLDLFSHLCRSGSIFYVILIDPDKGKME